MSQPLDHAQVRAALVACSEAGDHLAIALVPMIDAADGGLAAATRSIGAWYDATMERVSGWYLGWSTSGARAGKTPEQRR